METRELIHKIEETFGKAVVSVMDVSVFPFVKIQADSLKSVLSFCTHDTAMQFDFLECITGMDEGQEFLLIYQLYSTKLNHRINIKLSLARNAPRVSSALGFWPGARYYEREISEMLGITFDGNDSSKHLFLPEDWQGYPLRKDYVYPQEYHGVEHRREPLRKEHVRP
jgi:NADH-quinone oxidoreductase subunit C